MDPLVDELDVNTHCTSSRRTGACNHSLLSSISDRSEREKDVDRHIFPTSDEKGADQNFVEGHFNSGSTLGDPIDGQGLHLFDLK
jgi:hypothetical protein